MQKPQFYLLSYGNFYVTSHAPRFIGNDVTPLTADRHKAEKHVVSHIFRHINLREKSVFFFWNTIISVFRCCRDSSIVPNLAVFEVVYVVFSKKQLGKCGRGRPRGNG